MSEILKEKWDWEHHGTQASVVSFLPDPLSDAETKEEKRKEVCMEITRAFRTECNKARAQSMSWEHKEDMEWYCEQFTRALDSALNLPWPADCHYEQDLAFMAKTYSKLYESLWANFNRILDQERYED